MVIVTKLIHPVIAKKFSTCDIRHVVIMQGKDYDLNLPITTSLLIIPDELYEQIIAVIDKDTSTNKCFFLDGTGGDGKTFVYKLLLAVLHADG